MERKVTEAERPGGGAGDDRAIIRQSITACILAPGVGLAHSSGESRNADAAKGFSRSPSPWIASTRAYSPSCRRCPAACTPTRSPRPPICSPARSSSASKCTCPPRSAGIALRGGIVPEKRNSIASSVSRLCTRDTGASRTIRPLSHAMCAGCDGCRYFSA